MPSDVLGKGKVLFPEGREAVVKQAMIAAILGLCLMWAADFSNIAVFHNGAHDSRHSIGFPCH